MTYDLHIHSCLSPCASGDMTPLNIAHMARLKSLDIISLTDHNAGHNLPAMADVAKACGLVFIPGIEATSREEVHVLLYFSSLEDAVELGNTLYASLPDTANHPEFFGDQTIMDANDVPCGTLDKLLLQATPYSVEDLAAMARRAGGCAVPAHINRDSFSILSNLGFIPDGLFSCVEVAPSLPCPAIDTKYHKLFSSDAHNLGAISEPNYILQDITNPQQFVEKMGL